MTMSNGNGHFGDTTLTKVFVGGLAWETQNEALREHFDKYGEILEAVIISDKVTGRSKGYGFVTYKDAEAAKKACEDPSPVINGRRANCNLASLGARRPRSSTLSTPQQGSNGGPRSMSPLPAPGSQVQWYYPPASPATPFLHRHPAVPFYGYNHHIHGTYINTYIMDIAADISYNHKLSYSGGSYMNGHYPQVYQSGQGIVNANGVMPVYPFYHFHQPQTTMGLPAHIFPSTTSAPMATVPTLISKPTAMAPNTVCLAVE